MPLLNAMQTRKAPNGEPAANLEDLTRALNALAEPVVRRFNEISPRMLGHLPNEPLPTKSRELLSFRSRVALLIEFYVVDMLARFIAEDEGERVVVTFNTTNQFSDFFFRDSDYFAHLRIDVKATHLDSDEASARFTLPIDEVRVADDFILYATWQWERYDYQGVLIDAPKLLGVIIIPAITVAKERDLRRTLSGGSFSAEGQPLAKSGKKDTNFGKVHRLVHKSRLESLDLDPLMRSLATNSYLATSPIKEPEKLNELFSDGDKSESTASE